MNRYFVIVLSFICPIVSLAYNQPASLVGSWYARDNQKGLFCLLNFHENGKFDGYVDYQSKHAVSFEGTWQLKSGIIFYVYTKSVPVNFFKEGKDQDELIELTKTYYVFKGTNGERHRYDRVMPGKLTEPNQPLSDEK